MAKKSEGSESKPRAPRGVAVKLDRMAQAKIAEVVETFGLPRKTVMEAASAIASNAIIGGLVAEFGTAKLDEARATVARLEQMLDVPAAAGEPYAEEPVED
jgi:CHASE3 domain sensor protein